MDNIAVLGLLKFTGTAMGAGELTLAKAMIGQLERRSAEIAFRAVSGSAKIAVEAGVLTGLNRLLSGNSITQEDFIGNLLTVVMLKSFHAGQGESAVGEMAANYRARRQVLYERWASKDAKKLTTEQISEELGQLLEVVDLATARQGEGGRESKLHETQVIEVPFVQAGGKQSAGKPTETAWNLPVSRDRAIELLDHPDIKYSERNAHEALRSKKITPHEYAAVRKLMQEFQRHVPEIVSAARERLRKPGQRQSDTPSMPCVIKRPGGITSLI